MDQFQLAGQTDADPYQSAGNGTDMITNTQHVATPAFTEKGRNESKLRFFSFAKAANNKELDSWDVEFYPMEHMPFTDGEINHHYVEYKSEGEDHVGGSYNTTIQTSNAMTATWLREGDGNRLTAPDVRRGERLKIYQYADQDKYYWEVLGMDNHLRRLETVIWGLNSDPDFNSGDENYKTDYEHAYSLEFSTHRKHIRLHTTELNKEFCGYDIEINTDKGFVLIIDTVGNYIHLDSSQNRIELYNADGSHYDMIGPKLEVTIPESTSFKTGHFRVEAGAVTLATARLGVTGFILSGGVQVAPAHVLGTFGDDGVATIGGGSSGASEPALPGPDAPTPPSPPGPPAPEPIP